MMRCRDRGRVVVLILAGLQLAACTPAPAAVEVVPAAHAEPIEGTDLKRVVLTEKAAQRLDLQTTVVQEESVVRRRIVGGEVLAAPATANPDSALVRVLLTESDFRRVDRDRPVRVLSLDDDDDDDGLEAEADDGPADDDGVEAEDGSLYYRVTSAEQNLTPGQRVLVEVHLSGEGAQAKIIPYSAVIYDVHGETWVYASPEPLVFVREPVDIAYIEGDLAVLVEGPEAGTLVVTVGAAELYGVESGVGGGH